MSLRVCECNATACPSSNVRRSIGRVSLVMCLSMTKNVAATSCCRRTSSRCGVAVGIRAVVKRQVDRWGICRAAFATLSGP